MTKHISTQVVRCPVDLLAKSSYFKFISFDTFEYMVLFSLKTIEYFEYLRIYKINFSAETIEKTGKEE
jgi:hypothetical protein